MNPATVLFMMDSKRSEARVAGLLYLMMALTGPFGIVYVPSKILAHGDAIATAANLATHPTLVRFGVLSSLVCQVTFVFLALALGRLLKGVNSRHAAWMVALVVASVPIAVVNELALLTALQLAEGGDQLAGLTDGQRSALALTLVNVHGQGITLVGYFWGLWLFPFGLLVMRSGFIPKTLGVLLIVSCFSYLIESTVVLLAPAYRETVANFIALPMAAGELAMVFWLLLKGVREIPVSAPQAESAG